MATDGLQSRQKQDADDTRAPYAAPEAAYMGSAEDLTRGASASVFPDNPNANEGFKYSPGSPETDEDDDVDDNEND